MVESYSCTFVASHHCLDEDKILHVALSPLWSSSCQLLQPLSLKPHIHLCPEAMWSVEDDNHPGKSHLPSLTDSVLKAGQTFPVKPQMVNFLDFSGHWVHVTTTLFCPCNTRVHGQAHEWAGLGSSESWWHLNVNFVKLSHYKMLLLLLLLSRFSRVQLLCDPIDGSPPGSSIPGTLQARILEWVAISFSNAWKWKVKVKSLSPVWLLVTPWTAAYQAPPSMGFSRQEY